LPFDVDMPPMPKVDDGIEATLSHIIGGILGLDIMGVVGALSMTFCLVLNTFQMACPFVAFNYAKTFSFCNTSFTLPFSLEVLVFNSFKT
jgi:ammonia channel protein AmtB